MLRGLFSILLLISSGAGQVFATNITAGTGGRGDSLTVLRGMAEVMLKESQERGTLSEGEELIVRRGGSTGGATIDPAAEQKKWQDALGRLGGSVAAEDIPGILKDMQQSQGDNFKNIQDLFKSLSGKSGISEEEQQGFLKNVERQLNVLLEDTAILSGLQLKINTLLADPATSTATRVQLASCLKMIGDSRTALQRYQSESTKIIRMGLKTSSPALSAQDEQKKIIEAAASIGTEVTGLANEVGSNPDGMSQAWFKEGQDKLNTSLKELDELYVQTQNLLNADPTNPVLLGTLKQLSGQRDQAISMLKNFAVVEVPASVITSIQDLNDTASQTMRSIQTAAEAIRKNGGTKAQIDGLFALYDEMMAQYAAGQKLFETTMKAAAGQKYRTTEQQELTAAWNLLADTLKTLGVTGDQLDSPDRDTIWSAYLKEKKEEDTAAQAVPAQFELINDVTPGALLPGKPYLPLTPAATKPDVAAQLSGAVIGDVLVKDNVSYGIDIKTTSNSSGDLKTGLLNGAVLVVFKIKDGVYTERNVSSPVNVYDGAAHTALGWDADGKLAVFINHTGSDNTAMTGTLYSLDKDTLGELDSTDLFSSGDQGWYPRVTEDGKIEYISKDIQGDEHACLDLVCQEPISPPHAFQEQTDAIRAGHSNFTFNTAATLAELPTEVVSNRLIGETEATPLGTYSYLSWGRWNDGAGVADTIYTNSPWIAGSLTDGANIPVTGSASYNGKVLGKLDESGAVSAIGGTSALTADFAARSLTGTFTMTKNDAAWTNAAVTAGWGAGKNSINGTLAADNNMTGAVNGNFFGPAVNQVGGSWNLQNSGGTDRAAGVFTGNKQ